MNKLESVASELEFNNENASLEDDDDDNQEAEGSDMSVSLDSEKLNKVVNLSNLRSQNRSG